MSWWKGADEIIAFNSGSVSSTEITYGMNIFKIWRKKFRGKHTLQDVQADFQNGENGLVKLSLIDRMEETDTGIYESKL